MRDAVPEWYPLSDDERELVLQTGTFVFDASSLLSLYRMSLDDRRLVVDLLHAVGDRVWIPYQVALEYQRNRLSVYFQQTNAYEQLVRKIAALREQLVESLREHPVLTQPDIRREIEDRLNSLARFVAEKRRERHPADLADPNAMDGVRDGLDSVFGVGNVGPRVVLDDALLAEARKRFERRIPPGYEDTKRKDEPERFGDYFVWKQTLDQVGAGSDSRPLMLVTEETKRDWWLFDPAGRIAGPRPELVTEAAGLGIRPFWLADIRTFFTAVAGHLRWAQTELGAYTPVAEIPDLDQTATPPESMDAGSFIPPPP
jgi:hypothetical protein